MRCFLSGSPRLAYGLGVVWAHVFDLSGVVGWYNCLFTRFWYACAAFAGSAWRASRSQSEHPCQEMQLVPAESGLSGTCAVGSRNWSARRQLAAVPDWPTPQNLSQLRSFIGLCSYYRRFVQDFANVAAPLHALQRKQVPFHWTWEQEDAFNQLNQRLTSTPVLGMPTDVGTFYLDCDASDVGLGSVLSQEQGGSEVVVAYASWALSMAERN